MAREQAASLLERAIGLARLHQPIELPSSPFMLSYFSATSFDLRVALLSVH